MDIKVVYNLVLRIGLPLVLKPAFGIGKLTQVEIVIWLNEF